VFGLRLNVWTSILMFVAAATFFLISSRRHPGRETVVYRDGWGPDGRIDPDADESDTRPTDESGSGDGRVEA
jgi:hypothetical protein